MHHSNRHLAAVVAAVLFLAAAPASAATIVVKPGGPVPTIADAIAAAKDGDKIVISRGVYYESVVVMQSNLTIVGKRAIWDGTNADGDRTCLRIQGNGCTVLGMRFGNGGDQLVIEGDDATVRACLFRGSSADGISIEGAASATIDRCRFEGLAGIGVNFDASDGGDVTRCTFRNSGDNPVYVANTPRVTVDRCSATYLAWGFDFRSSPGCTITRSRVRHVGTNGIRFSRSDGALISRCTTHNTYGAGVYAVNSADVTIESCRLSGAREDDIVYTWGTGFVIRNNRMSGSYENGIEHEGVGALIENNVIFDTVYGAITLSNGDNGIIRRNQIGDDGAEGGIEAGGDGITIEDNTVKGVVRAGVHLSGNAGTVRANAISDCCDGRGEAAFVIEGDDNTVSDNSVRNTYGDGFNVNGDRNTLTRCQVRTAIADGFDIESGDGNALVGCSADDCGGEALDNSGTNTGVANTRLSNSRILLGNDGSFDVFTGNNVDLGDAVRPEVD